MEGKPGPIQPLEGSSAERSRYRPFNVHWLDSALHETLLPGSPWEQVHDRISEKLVTSLESDLDGSKEERQMILQLLGPLFVRRYMENVLYRPDLLDPSVLGVEQKKQLQHSAQVHLKDKLDGVIKDLGYARPSSSASDANRSNRAQQGDGGPSDMQAAIDHTRRIFRTGLERDCVIREMKLKKDQPAIKDLQDEPKADVQLTSSVSDLLGQSVVAILKRDPSRLDSVCRRLAGKQLPSSLRSYLWVEMLFRTVDNGGSGKPSEKLIRKKFAKAVSKGKVDMKISRATECPIGGLIETAVKEKYDATPCMRAHRQDKLHAQTREALNILFTYNRSYEPFLIHWIFPLQLALREHSHKEEHPYELALYLDFLRTYAFPKWPEVFATAEQVMAHLQRSDSELYDHLQQCAVTNVMVDPQEFLVQLIDAEKKKAAALSWSTGGAEPQDKAADKVSKELLANPLIFLRKWIGEGFVCVLSRQAVMYIWDQCFLEQWDRLVLERACLALLLQLREKFLQAADYHQMRQVFLNEPSKILTLDLVRSYQQLREDQRAKLVRSQQSATPQRSFPAAKSATATPEEPQPETLKLQRAGLKDVNLKLIWNLTESQLTGFQSDRIVVTLFLSVGEKMVQVKQIKDSVNLASWTKSNRLIFEKPAGSPGKDSTQEVNHHSSISEVVFSAKELDLLKFDRDLEPQVVLRVRYKTTDEEADDDQEQENKDSLGWALIPLYQKKEDLPSKPHENQDGTAHPFSLWVPSTNDRTVPLYFGEIPEDVTAEGAMKPFADGDLLQEGSEVSFTVYTSDKPWLEQDPQYVVDEGSPAEDGCDLYIDGIRFLPDNATVCKVTGRIVHPVDQNLPDVFATAVLDSSARCPKVTFRYTMPAAEATNLAVLRLYTVDKTTKDVVVIGAAVLQLYDQEGSKKLKTGGYQLQVHSGILPTEQMSVDAMSTLPIIPACSLLVRLLPRSEEFVAAPDYMDGYYNSESCRPSASELRVMGHYRKSASWEDTVRTKLQGLRQEGGATDELTDEALTEWQVDRLDFKKQSAPESSGPAEKLDLVRCVDYDRDEGLFVSVLSAKAISGDGMYTSVVAYIVPGSDVASGGGELRPSDKEQFLVQDVKPASSQNAPVYKDPPQKISPTYSTKSFLLLRVIGLSVTYKPDPENKGPGTVLGKDGEGPVCLEPGSTLGWTLVPLFDKGCVSQAMYFLPIFQDTGKFPFLKELSETSDLQEWMVNASQKGTITLNANHASLVLTLWDGHFDNVDTIPLPKEDRFLKVGDFEKFSQAADDVKGQPLSDLILQSFPPEVREEGVLSEMYWQEEGRFEAVMKTTVKDTIDKMAPLEE